MNHNSTTTPLPAEVTLIDRLKEIVAIRVSDGAVHDQLLMGIADDAAVYQPTVGTVQLITTDAFIEGIHFDLTYTSPKHLGWKVMAANLSDIAAMGGTPRYAVISIALPGRIRKEFIEQIYEGIAAACKRYSCLLIGGDTIASVSGLFISVTLVGEAKKEKILYRHGAKIGDLLCVTGHLGGSHAGLKILQREKARFVQSNESGDFTPDLESYTIVLEKHLMPQPRVESAGLLNNGISVHAMIDISDGLASETHRICRAGAVGARIEESAIPLHDNTRKVADEFLENPVDYALYGGEDFELLFTIGEDDVPQLNSIAQDVTVVGRIVPESEGVGLIKGNGETVALPFGGWDHRKQD